jgi:transcriptional regulator with XRE-family HTH domain
MSSALNDILMQAADSGKFPPAMAKPRLEETETVGDRIDRIRRAMGWENQFIAKQIGISPQQWRNYKMGANVIPPVYAVKLCLATGATTDFIYRNISGGISTDLAEKLAELERAERKPVKTA